MEMKCQIIEMCVRLLHPMDDIDIKIVYMTDGESKSFIPRVLLQTNQTFLFVGIGKKPILILEPHFSFVTSFIMDDVSFEADMDDVYALSINSEEMCRNCLARNCQLKSLFRCDIIDGEICPLPKVYQSVTNIAVSELFKNCNIS